MTPSLAQIGFLLRETTERLAYEVDAPSEHCPSWSQTAWQVAKASVAMQGTAAILSSVLRWQGPADWQAYLQDQKVQGALRTRCAFDLMAQIDAHAKSRGVCLTALKGAELYCKGFYPCGHRPMADLDLLTEPREMDSASRVLTDCGYQLRTASERHLLFTRPDPGRGKVVHLGEHADVPLKVELHARIAEHLPVRIVDITREIRPVAGVPGLNSYPSLPAMMLHLLLHAAGNMRANALRLIQLHDLALVARRMDEQDWAVLIAARPSGMRVWWAYPPLALAARYYPECIPAGVLACFAALSFWRLRHLAGRADLTAVSWSNLRIPAFPGLTWSASPREAVQFIARRIWPTKAALQELREAAAHMSLESASPWYGLPHHKRILRWLFSTPPRVQTLVCVRLALGADVAAG